MAKEVGDNALYPIAVLIDELRNDDVNVSLRIRLGKRTSVVESILGCGRAALEVPVYNYVSVACPFVFVSVEGSGQVVGFSSWGCVYVC